MSAMGGGTEAGRIASNSVRRLTRIAFLASALVFLVTIGLGFLNAVTAGSIPRWQSLTHLHSGTIGWILLSFVGVAIWLFTGEQETDAATRRLGWLVGLAIVAFAGLVASFAYGFSQGGAAMTPLGVFAPVAALLVWAIAIFALVQLRARVVATTARLLVALGLLLAAIGVTIGAWVAMNHAFGGGIPTPPAEAIGAHVLTVIPAVGIVAAGILEWLVRGDTAGRRSRLGLVQVAFGGLAGLMFPIGLTLLVLGVPQERLQPIFIGLLGGSILFTLLYLGRVGWRALRTNPLETGPASWAFFSTIWFIVFLPSMLLGPVLGDPEWLGILSIHAFFVGLVTNALLGVYSARTTDAFERYTWAEPAALWLVNLGIVVFVAVEAVAQVGHGAMVMGVGLLLGIAIMGLRLQQDGAGVVPEETAGEGVPK